MRVTSLAAGAVLCLACTSVAEPTRPPDSESAPSPPEPVASAPTPVAAEAEPEPPPEEERSEVAVRINARYAERTDAEEWSRGFEREGREAYDARAEILKTLALPKGSTIADVGAGSGLFTMEFSTAVGSEGVVFAVDVHDYFLEHIRDRAKAAGRANVRTVAASQDSVSLEPDSVDVVFLCDVYHHLERPATYLRSIREALRDDGRLVIIDYDRSRPGTRRWLRDHIRADPAVFRAEIEAAGFDLQHDHDLLEENFFFVFGPA